MGISTDIAHNSFEFEDSGNFTFQCSTSYEDENCSSPDSVFEYTFPTATVHVCYGCNGVVEDQYVLRLNDQSWHPTCLRCSHCHTILDNHNTCYVRGGNIYCRKDEFCIPCTKCNAGIRSDDWVRKARDNCYHLACFNCDICNRQLSTGEQFALHNNRLLCKIHYLQVLQGNRLGDERLGKRKSKRQRTAFTDDQVHIFQSYFDVEQNPDPQDLDTIAEQAGVARRVAQVWFQNARARSKRNIQMSMGSPASIVSKESSSPEHSFDSLDELTYSN
ncbi:LHX6_8 [Mytilus edulis]|uniref:LHX6_8 n=1 Tax=Mytilus edulis TaxID=6550 RepID=A0A8S3TC63_MYTED|nr:LHX6_8 [Mytilus edulis]